MPSRDIIDDDDVDNNNYNNNISKYLLSTFPTPTTTLAHYMY